MWVNITPFDLTSRAQAEAHFEKALSTEGLDADEIKQADKINPDSFLLIFREVFLLLVVRRIHVRFS